MATDLKGLTSAEVNQRISQGKVNVSSNLKTKSIGRIFRDNICTLFNAINVVLLIALAFVGSYKNMLFIGIMIANTTIGIVQEIRSKRSVDKLTILSEKKVTVVRDGKECEISREEIVQDDLIVLLRGSQIPADCVVCGGECRVNESLLTGESNLIVKQKGDALLSGSFISLGKCYAKVTKVGAECYAAKINDEAKYIKKINSEILRSFNFIIKICTFILFPLGLAFFIRQFGIQDGNLQATVVSTVAALLGMIPRGMILLTSSVLAVSVVRLTRKKVLVQEMYCIETLARVDVLCLDKTGTLTTDEMNVTEVLPLQNDDEINSVLASIAHFSEEKNATILAIEKYANNDKFISCKKFYPFSSETKWSGGDFENGKSYIIGAAEFVFKDKQKYKRVYDEIEKVKDTVRFIVLASSGTSLENGLPQDLTPLAIILIKDKLRDNVNETINYFKEQGVALKVISGDSVKTVQNIAKDTGIIGAENAVDMTTVKTQEELESVAESCSVFGRVTPQQKKQLVLALKKNGHSVAMTGDGVNDVLALKEADCSIAMAAGSDAARNVSQLVLVNNDFASMPGVVAEGRRTINNLERSSALYLVKTIYTIALSIFFVFFSMEYPFQPIHLSLIGALTVGFPSFVLALQPNKNRIKGNFTYNIISRAIPTAFCTILNIIVMAIIAKVGFVDLQEYTTICVYMTALCAYMLILRLSYPFNALRIAMLVLSATGIILGCIIFSKFFSLVWLSFKGLVLFALLSAFTAVLFNLLYNYAEKLIEKNKNKYK